MRGMPRSLASGSGPVASARVSGGGPGARVVGGQLGSMQWWINGAGRADGVDVVLAQPLLRVGAGGDVRRVPAHHTVVIARGHHVAQPTAAAALAEDRGICCARRVDHVECPRHLLGLRLSTSNVIFVVSISL
jgi:hypothetical protein